jgi:probable F420-dependent oxidoreductase
VGERDREEAGVFGVVIDMGVKVRIGVALGPWADAARFSASVDRLEEMGVDSLWISELVFGSLVEPFIGMAHALARTSRLKVGTGVAILPGRHPVLVAKQLASLAALSPGRVLPAFGLQPARAEERALFPVPSGRRAAVFDESLELLRLLLREESVSFTGQYFTVEGASVGPLPAKPLDIWTGGSAPGALRRTGRLADGWLGSFLTPAEAGAARETIQAAAADAGREIEEDHFGISLAVVTGSGGAGGDGPASLVRSVRARRPDVDPALLFASGWADARAKIEQYVEVGLSKFVVRPAGETASQSGLDEFLERFATEMMPLQN